MINKLTAFSTTHLKKIVTLITAVLLGVAIFYGAKITWLLVTPMPQVDGWQAPKSNEIKSQMTAIDFSNYYWFGRPNAPVKKPVVQKTSITHAPKTSLNMTLTGVVASKDIKRSMAIIEYRSTQDTYLINQSIKSSRVTVAEIHSDRVILKNNGQYETLMLDGFDYRKPQVNNRGNLTPKQPIELPKKKVKLAKVRRDILKNPGKIIDYITITPVSHQGKMKGYRLNPGKEPELFNQAGLKARDLAVAINGYDLTDRTQSMRVLNELQHMKNIMITVERNGQLTDIEFALP